MKNNLQTISSLLRLQARRLPKGDGRHALEEAERRVRSIAVVHEILSRDTTDEVDFNDILPSLVRMAEDLSSATVPTKVTWSGEAGQMGAQVATPLAVALNELMQNAVEHAFVVLGGHGAEHYHSGPAGHGVPSPGAASGATGPADDPDNASRATGPRLAQPGRRPAFGPGEGQR